MQREKICLKIEKKRDTLSELRSGWGNTGREEEKRGTNGVQCTGNKANIEAAYREAAEEPTTLHMDAKASFFQESGSPTR